MNKPSTCRGTSILHEAEIIRIKPISYYITYPLTIGFGQEPNISHLRMLVTAEYVSITPPQRTMMGPQMRLGIYVGFESPSII